MSKGNRNIDNLERDMTSINDSGVLADSEERVDSVSTDSSGIGSSATSQESTPTPTPEEDDKKKQFTDVSLKGWNIWQEDSTFIQESDSEEEWEQNGDIKRYRAPAATKPAGSKKKRIHSFLRRLSLRDSREISSESRASLKPRSPKSKPDIRVDSLPQYFVVKYLGCRRSTGLWGLQHTRQPVDDLVEAVGQMKHGKELTLAQLHVVKTGIHMSAHQDNKGAKINAELVPIQSISYGVQDVKFTRVFCLIIVREMARHAKKMECHAFVCNASATARKLALSVALAFEKYAEKLKGRPYKFEVDLHSQTEKAKAKDPKAKGGGEFEA